MRHRDKAGRFVDEGKRIFIKCPSCKKRFETLHNKFCSKNCYAKSMVGKTGKDTFHWQGGRRIDKDGYVLIYNLSHPHRIQSTYILEHRIVCEKRLGRLLEKGEIPHHINENKADNRSANLYLFPNKSEHTRYHLLVKSGKIKRIKKSNLP